MAIQTLTFGEYLVDGLNAFILINSEYVGILKRLIGFMTIWLVCFMNLFSLVKNYFLKFFLESWEIFPEV